MEWLNAPGVIAAALSALAGVLGRLMYLSQVGRDIPLRTLPTELLIGVSMGWMGRALGEHIGLGGFPLFGFPIAVSYVGPTIIPRLVDRVIKPGRREGER